MRYLFRLVISSLAIIVVGTLIPGLVALASTYGGCSYGQSTDSSGACGAATPTIQLGPLTLPDTGATWVGLAGAVVFAIGVGLLFWLHQRSQKRPVSNS